METCGGGGGGVWPESITRSLSSMIWFIHLLHFRGFLPVCSEALHYKVTFLCSGFNSLIYISSLKFRDSNKVAEDNRVTRGKKKGALRWHGVVGGCDDLEQVPGGSKMEMMLP